MNSRIARIPSTSNCPDDGLSWRPVVLVLISLVTPALGKEPSTATAPPAGIKGTANPACPPEKRSTGVLAFKTPTARANASKAEMPATERAIRIISECQARYSEVNDYTCTFYKRERIDGKLTPLHIMSMKVRTKPQSIYFRFQQPAQGREAIYIAGRNGGKVLAHDVGFNKLLAGTLALDPTGSRAMEDCRHPITEAGIGPLLDTLTKRWATELSAEHSLMAFDNNMMVGSVRCTMIESMHPIRRPEFLHYKVRVFIDQELGLPIRFEAFDWPRSPGSEPELVEEYSYAQLKLNVGLQAIDFDVSNSEYAFGRL